MSLTSAILLRFTTPPNTSRAAILQTATGGFKRESLDSPWRCYCLRQRAGFSMQKCLGYCKRDEIDFCELMPNITRTKRPCPTSPLPGIRRLNSFCCVSRARCRAENRLPERWRGAGFVTESDGLAKIDAVCEKTACILFIR